MGLCDGRDPFAIRYHYLQALALMVNEDSGRDKMLHVLPSP
jgi:hypothetical protein